MRKNSVFMTEQAFTPGQGSQVQICTEMSSTRPSYRWRSAIHLFSGDSRSKHLQARLHIISKHWTAGYIDTTPGRNWVVPMGSLLYIADKNVRTVFSWELYGGCTLTLAERNCWNQELILDSSLVLFITQHVLSLRWHTHFIIVIRKLKKWIGSHAVNIET